METRAPEPVTGAGQYLTFRVARERFALDAARLRGILPVRDLEPVAPSPDLYRFFGEWICGFTSLRGQDIAVIDLRGRLKLPHATHGRHPCIIVVEIETPNGQRMAGFIADRVSEVVYARGRDVSDGKLVVRGRSRLMLDPDLLLNP